MTFRLKPTCLLLIFLALAMRVGLRAEEDRAEVRFSTKPIGSAFYRHLAYDYQLDLKELVKFERRGFSRTEIVTLALISSATEKPIKEYGKRRIKDKVPLKTLASEAQLDYSTLYGVARKIKEEIEAKGEENLPPPVYEVLPTPEQIERERANQRKLEKEQEKK